MNASTSKKESVPRVDKGILCLFPSLDFTRTNDYPSRVKKKTMLTILARVAECGVVTKYDLTKNAKGGFPRLGGETAQKTLQELEKLDLLEARTIESIKKTPKIERFLTAKGVIACLSMCEFQQAKKLDNMLQRPTLRDSNLATFMLLYDDTIAGLLRVLGVMGFNLELKDQKSIIEELIKVNDLKVETGSLSSLDRQLRRVMPYAVGLISQKEEIKKPMDEFLAMRNVVVNTKNPSSELYGLLALKAQKVVNAVKRSMKKDKEFAEEVNRNALLFQFILKMANDRIYMAALPIGLPAEENARMNSIIRSTGKDMNDRIRIMRELQLEYIKKDGFLIKDKDKR